MIESTPSPNPTLSEFIRYVLFKSNKKCQGCDLICFEDEQLCPECHGYLFVPYIEHLKNYSSEATQEKVEDNTEILESQLY